MKLTCWHFCWFSGWIKAWHFSRVHYEQKDKQSIFEKAYQIMKTKNFFLLEFTSCKIFNDQLQIPLNSSLLDDIISLSFLNNINKTYFVQMNRTQFFWNVIHDFPLTKMQQSKTKLRFAFIGMGKLKQLRCFSWTVQTS